MVRIQFVWSRPSGERHDDLRVVGIGGDEGCWVGFDAARRCFIWIPERGYIKSRYAMLSGSGTRIKPNAYN